MTLPNCFHHQLIPRREQSLSALSSPILAKLLSEMYIGFHIKYLPVLKKSKIYLQILVKIPNMKFHKNQLV